MNAFYPELIKLKNSGHFWLALAGSLLTNVMLASLAILLTRPDNLELIPIQPIDSWHSWVSFHYDGISGMLLPMFLVIICSLAILQEQRSNTWKQLYTMPVRRTHIYLAKLLAIILLFGGSHLLFLMVMLIIPNVSNLGFDGPTPYLLAFHLYTGTFISAMSILSLVYLVCYYSSRFVLPLAVGIIGFVLAQLLQDYGIASWWLPFALPSLALESIFSNDQIAWGLLFVSLVGLVVFTIVGLVLVDRKRIKT